MLKYNKTLLFFSLLHKRCERLVKIVFCRRDVDDHQSFSISTQRVLHHLREMKHILVDLLVYVGVQNWKTRIQPFLFITCVSLLFLYGTWGSSADKAEITSPSALKDLLMEFASCTEENMEEFKEVMTNLSTTHWPMKHKIGADLQLVVLGTCFGCSLTACQVYKAQLPTAYTPVCQIPALHHDANNKMRAGTLHVHLLKNDKNTTG